MISTLAAITLSVTAPSPAVVASAVSGTLVSSAVFAVVQLAKAFIPETRTNRPAEVRALAVIAAVGTVFFAQFAPPEIVAAAGKSLAVAVGTMGGYQYAYAPIVSKLTPTSPAAAEVATVAQAVSAAVAIADAPAQPGTNPAS